MCSRATAWLLVEPQCRTVLAGTRFHSAPFSCAVALFFLLVLPCSFFLLFPSLSLSVSLSLFFCALFFNPFPPLTAESVDALVHERGEKRKRARPQREKKSAKEDKVASSFFLFLDLSLLSSPLPSLRPTNHPPTTGLARRGRQGRRRGRQGRRRGRERRRRPRRRGSRLRGRRRARRGRSRPGGRGQGPDVAARRAFPGDQPVEALLHAVQRVLPMRGAEGRGGRGVQIREFVVFGFWNFLGEREKKKKTRGRKNSPPFLFSLFYNNDNANNNSTSARTARSAPRSGSRSGRSSGRQASLFLYSPPFFFITRRRRPALEKGCPTTRISLVLFSTSTAQQQQKNASSQQARTPASTRWLV